LEAWQGYISHPMGFGVWAPGEVKVEKGSYNTALAGQREATVYHFVDDNIDYKVTVVEMGNKTNDAANLLGEAEHNFQDGKKVLMDAFGRVDREFGRKITVDLPNNGGRSTSAFYFINGRILWLQAVVLPAIGHNEPSEGGRFVDSITFFTVRAADDAYELPAAPQ
jgi:hypothetical protein